MLHEIPIEGQDDHSVGDLALPDQAWDFSEGYEDHFDVFPFIQIQGGRLLRVGGQEGEVAVAVLMAKHTQQDILEQV